MAEHIVYPGSDGFDWKIEGYGTGNIRWNDVRYVELFKRDLLTTDVVCMNLKLSSGDWFLLTEEVVGFIDLVKVMNKAWSLGDEWYGKVVLPPFETCKVVITPPSETSGNKAVFDWSKP